MEGKMIGNRWLPKSFYLSSFYPFQVLEADFAELEIDPGDACKWSDL
jgi:hypothetical protein